MPKKQKKMARKPRPRTNDKNTYRLRTFHERIAMININSNLKLKSFGNAPIDGDTFFAEALGKWTDLDCSPHFQDFKSEIYEKTQSMSQLVHHQEEIVDALIKHLQVPRQVPKSLAVESLLDLTVQLARDLQEEFQPRFERFFHAIHSLINTYHDDADVLEQSFSTLAYLMKVLWRYNKDIPGTYEMFAPLLASKKKYIVTFAAQSLSYLLRKYHNPDELIATLYDDLIHKKIKSTDIVLTEMLKGYKTPRKTNKQNTKPAKKRKAEEMKGNNNNKRQKTSV